MVDRTNPWVISPWIRAVAVALIVLWATGCRAESEGAWLEEARAAHLGATCAACHGTGGHSVTAEAVGLAGLPEEFLVERMVGFRDEQHAGTVMHHLAKGYTDEEVALIAAYFASRESGSGGP